MDLERDLFTVESAGRGPTVAEMVRAIEKAGFESELVGSRARPGEPVSGRRANRPVPAIIQTGLDRARKEGKLLLVDFHAEWCLPCKRMLKETWQDPRLEEVLGRFIFLKVDTDKHPRTARAFRVSAIPDVRVLSPDGSELGRMLGFKNAEEVLNVLRATGGNR